MPLLSGMQAMEDLRRKGCDIPFVLVSTPILESGLHQTEGQCFCEQNRFGA